MHKNSTRIAHISDLHFTTFINSFDPLEQLKIDLPKQNPDLIFVTGDIAENCGSKDQKTSLTNAKMFLELLCTLCSLEPKDRLFVVPGNHDYRFRGVDFLCFKKVGYLLEFQKIFEAYYRGNCIPELNCIVYCFDSNTTEYNINIATGQVLMGEFNRFDQENEKWRRKYSNEFPTMNKLALLHHHTMPVYLSEVTSSASIFSREPFLILNNSATFMREMIKRGVRLILHGHQHKRGFAIASFPTGLKSHRDIAVISAGSVGKLDYDEDVYSYNIVDLSNSGEISLSMRILEGQGSYNAENDESYEIFGKAKSKLHYYNETVAYAPSRMKRLRSFCKIYYPSGDLAIETFFEDWQASQSRIEKLEFNLRSEAGIFTEKPNFEVSNPTYQKIEWKSDGPAKDGLQKGHLTFNPPLASKPITGRWTLIIPNAFSFIKDDRKADKEGKYEPESTGPSLKIYSPERLDLCVLHPDGFKPIDPEICVTDEKKIRLSWEEENCNENFIYSVNNNMLSFAVDYPLFNKQYSIAWDLPDNDLIMNEADPTKIAKAEEIQKKLLKLANIGKSNNGIDNCLELIYNDINENYPFLKKGNGDNRLEVCLAAYDPKEYKIRYVGHFCPFNRINHAGLESEFWQKRIKNGRPICGAARKRNETVVALYPKQGPSEGMKQYLRNPACSLHANDFLKSIVSIPLVYPYYTNNVVCILELASCSNNSILLGLGDGKPEEKEAKKAAITLSAQRKYLEKFICPVLDANIEKCD